jgi:hypothetical protein
MQPSGMHLSLSHIQRLCVDLPRAGGFDAAMQLIESVRHDALGPGLLTVHVNLSNPAFSSEAGDSGPMVLQRLWTSHAQSYPVGGRKHKALTPWSEQLLLRAEVFVGEGVEVLRQVFDDHALIESLGLQAVVNVPLLDAQGRCFATFNVLGTSAKWTQTQHMWILLLSALATPVVKQATLNFGQA